MKTIFCLLFLFGNSGISEDLELERLVLDQKTISLNKETFAARTKAKAYSSEIDQFEQMYGNAKALFTKGLLCYFSHGFSFLFD